MDVDSLSFSLKTMCAVKVAYQILEAVGVKRRVVATGRHDTKKRKDEDAIIFYKEQNRINSGAKARVEALELPTSMHRAVAGLIRPIFHELYSWYNDYLFDTRPIWTPYGTVDMIQSTKVVVEDPDLMVHYRFMVACAFCHHRQIYEISKLLTDFQKSVIRSTPPAYPGEYRNLAMWGLGDPEEILEWKWKMLYEKRFEARDMWRSEDGSPMDFEPGALWNPLAKYWLDLCVDTDTRLHPPQEWSEKGLACEKGLIIALRNRNETAIRYFLDKAMPEDIPGISEVLERSTIMIKHSCLQPRTYRLLLSKISDADLRQNIYGHFINGMLLSLTVWPYQSLFLDVGFTFSVYVDSTTFFAVLSRIATKAAAGYEDVDYSQLFTGFWTCVQDVGNFPCKSNWEIAKYVLVTKDERWINFVFCKFSAEEKESFLLGKRGYNKWVWYMIVEEFETLELLIRACVADDIHLLDRYEETIGSRESPKRCLFCPRFRESDRAMKKRIVLGIVTKIRAEFEKKIPDEPRDTMESWTGSSTNATKT